MGFAVGFNTMPLSTSSADFREREPFVTALGSGDYIDALSSVDCFGGGTVREAMLAKAAERGHRIIEDLRGLI